MKQMIRNWKEIESLGNSIARNKETNTTEFGENVEIDGNLKVNGAVEIDENLKVNDEVEIDGNLKVNGAVEIENAKLKIVRIPEKFLDNAGGPASEEDILWVKENYNVLFLSDGNVHFNEHYFDPSTKRYYMSFVSPYYNQDSELDGLVQWTLDYNDTTHLIGYTYTMM